MAPPTDNELVSRFVRHGDEQAFQALYRRHVDVVYRMVARILGPRGEVEDAVQEIFLQVNRSLDGFHGESRFTTWLHRLVVNVATSALRQRLRPPADPGPPRADPDPDDRLDAREQVLALYHALDELPEHNRVAFVLFELEGMPLEELAVVTGVPLQAAAARLRRARVALARALGRGTVAGQPAAEQREEP